MKKFYAFLAAALLSVSAFAAKDVVPSDAVLADYYDQGQVCVCFFVPADMACNDIVLTGSFNGFSGKVEDCIKCEPIEGYDGWYVAAYDPEEEPNAEKGLQAKPVMLDVDGNFNWEYQVGTATAIRGGVTVVAGYEGEIDLIHYDANVPNVFTVDSWKQNPCTAVYHNYTIYVVSDGCDGYVVPFIAGAMTSWTDNGWTQMQYNSAKTAENGGVPTYSYTFKGAENTPYQITSGKMNDEGEIVEQPGWNDDAYIQVLVDGQWTRLNPSNSFTGTEGEIIWDLRADTLRWARCAPQEDPETVEMNVKLPALNCPESVEVIGTFDDWQGTAMAFENTGYFYAFFEAKPSQYFKFRSAGLWPNEGGTELEVYDAENDEWRTIKDNELVFSKLWEDGSCYGDPCKTITLDFSDPDNYRWKVQEQGIENVVLTEKAHKVIVDGVLYIVRDNKMFNVQGTQVR